MERLHDDQRGMTTNAVIRTLLWFAAIGALLFVAAGDWLWPAGWVFLAENVLVSVAIVVWLARHDLALLKERMAASLHRDQLSWDRVFLAGFMLVFLAWFVLMALDARRYAWSHMPTGLQLVGAAAIAGCMVLVWRVFQVNSFAVPQVRAQAARTQTVISTGPYAFVRHPMYSGALLYFVGTPLLLGSWLGLAAGLLLSLGFGARAIGEEAMLRRDVAGYEAYAARVRYRLVPGIW